jgi:hypothetical protein
VNVPFGLPGHQRSCNMSMYMCTYGGTTPDLQCVARSKVGARHDMRISGFGVSPNKIITSRLKTHMGRLCNKSFGLAYQDLWPVEISIQEKMFSNTVMYLMRATSCLQPSLRLWCKGIRRRTTCTSFCQRPFRSCSLFHVKQLGTHS